MENINLFDVFVLVSIVALMYNGFNNGFVKETISIAGIFAGLYVSLALTGYTVSIVPVLAAIEFSEFIAFVSIYIVSILVASSIGTQANSLLIKAQLKTIDDLGGIVMSIVKSLLILSVLTFILSKEEIANSFINKITKNSISYPYIYDTGKIVMDNMPNSNIITNILSDIKNNFTTN